MSLRDQLLKAGLVSEDKIKKHEAESRKQDHRVKKGDQAAQREAERRAAEEKRLAEEAERKRARDREINLKREADKQRREQRARIQQILNENRCNQADAVDRYYFQDGRFARSVRVTPQQQADLAQGRLGIARNPKDEFDFPIVVRAVADKLAAIDPKLVILLHPEGGSPDDDWGDVA
ncbi:MAG: DUF2058 family protein [Gammaproteobacteria bacterium]